MTQFMNNTMSSVLAATDLPVTDAPSVLSTLAPQIVEESPSYLQENMLWMGLWFSALLAFLAYPFCSSKRRRQAFAQGCRERRWVSADPDDDLPVPPRPSGRQQQRQETRRRFQINQTQEDGIRQQYLSLLMQNYTIALRKCDIYDDQKTEESSTASIEEQSQDAKHDIESQCDATINSSSMESGGTANPVVENNHGTDLEVSADTMVRENRCDSDDSENLLEYALQKHQTVCVPLAGQAVTKETDPKEGAPCSNATTDARGLNRRIVSNGCAICLCPFDENEEITWSSNPDCCHVFHNDCIVNWYLAYGRKAQRRRLRNNPNMSDDEALDFICDFPILCPCCRQEFCVEGTCHSTSCEQDEEIGGAR